MRLKSALRRGVATAVIAGIVVSSGIPAYAARWDIANGDITVKAGDAEGKNKVSQGETIDKDDTNTVITGEDDAEVLDAIQSMVANTQADGFILLYSKKDCPVAAYLRSEGLLHVIVGKAAQSANQTIYIDNYNALAGEEATDYLYEMGHRRIAYFGVSNAMLFSAERKRSYQMSLLKHDITPREGDCVEIDTLNDSYEPALKALLTAPDRPTAVLVSDDILAVVLEQFCSKLGLRIPKDLSIVSFNNSLFSRITNPPLTTVDVNPYQLGIEAASQTYGKAAAHRRKIARLPCPTGHCDPAVHRAPLSMN